jgi:hypothetical protein
MSLHALAIAFGWAIVAVGCAMAVYGVWLLVTGRAPRRIQASKVGSYARSLLFFAFFIVSTALPRLLDWPDELLIVFIPLSFVSLLVGIKLMAETKKVLHST